MSDSSRSRRTRYTSARVAWTSVTSGLTQSPAKDPCLKFGPNWRPLMGSRW